VGKTTQLALLVSNLKKHGYTVTATKEPGGTPKGEEIRARLLKGGLSPEEELSLFFEARKYHVDEVLKPAILRGDVVLCDRFSDSTFAYQHFARGQDRKMIEARDAEARSGLEPDLVIVLSMPPNIAFTRFKSRGGELDAFEKEGGEFHKKIHEAYLTLAREKPENHIVVDASESIEAVSEKIWNIVLQKL